MTERLRILCVEGRPAELAELRSALEVMQDEWEVSFATDGRQALIQLFDAGEPFDVLVTAARLPDIDAARMLDEVRRNCPQTIRIVLSAQTAADRVATLNAAGLAHQYLPKPCDVAVLKAVVDQACALREVLHSARLRQAIAAMKTLPSLPTLYYQLMRQLQSPNASLKAVGRIVARDSGMTAKILQLVNSAYFGMQQRVSDPVRAVIYLGLETIKALALSVQAFSQFERVHVGSLSLYAQQEHSLMVAALARRIAEGEQVERQIADYALAAGLLHDVGKLVLAVNRTELYDHAMELADSQQLPLFRVERELFGACHAEVGAYLVGIWGLPNPIVEALAYHHQPADHLSRQFNPVLAVHVANALVLEVSPLPGSNHQALLDVDLMAQIPGVLEQLPVWRAWCRELVAGWESA